MEKFKIDNVDYDESQLTDDAKAQIISINFVDSEIKRLQAQIAAYQTARNAYAAALKGMLPKTPKSK